MTYFDPSPALTQMMSETPRERSSAFDTAPPVVGQMSGALLATLGVSLWSLAAAYVTHFLLALA